ncbi:PREDICTED: AN1-type zinc finger protein 1-like, partial [Rhagoletis zephyria]|uniref:AN1-type zinc finger protein 1-like n=1 Tax=Rhagoletis zephyria TaxID=28612 RepID=UPI0008115E13
MVEEYGGRHCTICKQLTFLPLICTACGLPFCELHSSAEAHGCIAKHQVCKTNVDASSAADTLSASDQRCIQCGQSSLLARSVPLHCTFCQKPVCIAHRHRFDHACPKAETILAAERNARSEKLGDDSSDDYSETTPI